MKLSTLLLSSAALVVAGSAYAADLPAKKGAPAAKAMAGCPAFGAGYFAIPGGDTCLKISGFARSNSSYTTSAVTRGTAAYSLAGALYLAVDAKNNSELGTVSSTLAFYNNTVDEVYAQVAGWTFGQADTLADHNIGAGSNGGFYNSNNLGTIRYALPLGSSTLSLGVESAVEHQHNSAVSATKSGRPDMHVRLDTSAGAAKVTLGAMSHEATGSASGSANAYALLGSATISSGPAKVQLYGAYASGLSYILTADSTINSTGFYDVNTTSSTLSSGTNLGAATSFDTGAGTFGVWGNQVAINDASTTVVNYKYSAAGAYFKTSIAKGLWARPEIYVKNEDANGTTSSSSNLYLRIQRDF